MLSAQVCSGLPEACCYKKLVNLWSKVCADVVLIVSGRDMYEIIIKGLKQREDMCARGAARSNKRIVRVSRVFHQWDMLKKV